VILDFKTIYETVLAGGEADASFEAEGALYTRRFRPAERLLVLGCGHISQPLCRYAADLGFAVTAADDRPSFANSERFPEAESVLCAPFPEAIRAFGPGAGDYVAVVTRGHRHDADCLRELLAGPFPRYLGMIGSRRRVIALFDLLESEGFAREALDRIRAPIGVDIGAQTVKEIAFSIAAQLIECRRSGRRRRRGETLLDAEDADLPLLERLARETEPRAVLIVCETSGSTPVGSGAFMTVDRQLRTAGTIGGGCAENAVLLQAARLIGTGRRRCVTVDMSGDVAEDEGMVCGGSMRVLIADDSRG